MFFRRTFRARISTTMALAAISTGLLVAAMLFWLGNINASKQASASDRATFGLLLETARHYSANGHALALTPVLERTASSPSIELAVLTDAARRIVASSDPDWIGRPLGDDARWIVATIGDDESRGFVAMRRSETVWLRAMLGPSLLSLLFASCLAVLAIVLGSRRLFRRFLRLYIEAKGTVDVTGRDELATIGRAIDALKREAETQKLGFDDRNRQIRTLVDDLPVGMSYVDHELRMLFLNRILESWLGWKRSEMLGRRLSNFMTPEAYEETLRGVEPALRGTKVQRERDFTIDGRQARIATVNIPDRGADGKIKGVFSLLRDVTEQRRQEAETARLLEELEAKNAELERFSYTVSHDLKGPLTTIVGCADLIGLALDSDQPQAVAGDLDRIRSTADTMRRMLDELLERARVGLVDNQEERVDLGQLAVETVRLLAGSIDRHGTETILAEDLPVVLGDRQRLQRVLQNLIDNAVKFSAGVEQPRVEVGRRDDGGEKVIYVRDNGRGISPQQQVQVFDLFHKLDSQSEGTGIGLAIVHRIILAHQGRIWVESAGTGHGTTFCFTLPLAPEL